MKYIYLLVLLTSSLFANAVVPKYVPSVIPKKMTTHTKKERFYYLLVPVVQKVHKELMQEYESVALDINNSTNTDKIANLKASYKATTDEDLLARLKPHPQSITLAQAAIESNWATSRFFVEANNVFGMWSANPNNPRISASRQRAGKKTIWLRKFDSIEASVRAYYRLIGSRKAYAEFRALRLQTDDPYKLVKKLNHYSELKEAYGVELAKIIRYNKLQKYDIPKKQLSLSLK